MKTQSARVFSKGIGVIFGLLLGLMHLSASADTLSEPIRQFGYGFPSSNAVLSPDNSAYAVAHENKKIYIFNSNTGKQRRIIYDSIASEKSQVTLLAFSPDSTKLLGYSSDSSDSNLLLWDIATGLLYRRFYDYKGTITALAFSPDGTKVIAGSTDGKSRIWNTETANLLYTLSGHTDGVTSVAFSPDGASIITGSKDDRAKLWNAETGALLRTLAGHGGDVTSVDFSADGARVLTGSADNTAQLWEVNTGNIVRTFIGHGGDVIAVACSPDGTRIVTASEDKTIKVWNSITGQLLYTHADLEQTVSSAALFTDGSQIFSNTADGTITFLDSSTGTVIHQYFASLGEVLNFDCSPDNSSLVVSYAKDSPYPIPSIGSSPHNCTIRFMNPTDGSVTATEYGLAYSLRFSPDGSKLAMGIQDTHVNSGILKMRDMATGKDIFSISDSIFSGILTTCFSPDGSLLMTAGMSTTPKLLDTSSGKIVRSLNGESFTTFSYNPFTPDGKKVITGSESISENTARIWDTTTGKIVRTLCGHTLSVISVGISPDGSKAITGSLDNTAKLWNTATGAALYTFHGHTDGVPSVCFSPDGSKVLTTSNEAILWDVATGEKLRTFSHSPSIYHAIFSPDGANVIIGTKDGIIEFWPVSGYIVPDVVGRIKSEASTVITNTGLLCGTTISQYSATIPAGLVISQDPAAGTTFTTTTSVNLVVSKGPEPKVAVPNIVGLSTAEAKGLLDDAGFHTHELTEAYNPTVPAGTVISQDPAANSLASTSQPVKILISKGPQSVTTPDIVGKTKTEAKTALTAVLLIVGTVSEEYSATIDAGHVISQDPVANTVVLAGDSINLVISKGKDAVAVPEVIGKRQEEATAALITIGLVRGTVREEYSATIAAGKIISQSPDAGTEVPHGTAVDLVISKGKELGNVPNLSGMTTSEAESALTAVGLRTGAITRQYSASIPNGQVISQDPAAGTAIIPGAAVNLVLSKGPQPVAVPDLVGNTQADATAAITAVGLVVGTVVQQHSAAIPAGQVMMQNPPAGKEVAPGSSVAMVISIGPETVEEGENTPMTTEELQEWLQTHISEIDTNGDGMVSYTEAAIGIEGLAQEMFNALDSNGDGLLSADELDTSTGCNCSKSSLTPETFKKRLGDLFALSLALMGLIVLHRRRL